MDRRIRKLSDYAASPVLFVVFTCNYCPIAQMYEQRVQQLEQDYRGRGFAGLPFTVASTSSVMWKRREMLNPPFTWSNFFGMGGRRSRRRS